jgi:predicted nucleic-acid-binding Zn-ribbon protein
MPENDRCPKCGSEDLFPQVRIVDFAHGNYDKRSLKVEIVENPEAWVFKGIHQGVLTATICGQCGFAELYVRDPQELLEVYRRKQSQA